MRSNHESKHQHRITANILYIHHELEENYPNAIPFTISKNKQKQELEANFTWNIEKNSDKIKL